MLTRSSLPQAGLDNQKTKDKPKARLPSPEESQHGFVVIMIKDVKTKNSLSSSSLGLKLSGETNGKPSTKANTAFTSP